MENPKTDDYYNYKRLLEYAWRHAVKSDQEYRKAKKVCYFKLHDWTSKCSRAMSEVFKR